MATSQIPYGVHSGLLGKSAGNLLLTGEKISDPRVFASLCVYPRDAEVQTPFFPNVASNNFSSVASYQVSSPTGGSVTSYVRASPRQLASPETAHQLAHQSSALLDRRDTPIKTIVPGYPQQPRSMHIELGHPSSTNYLTPNARSTHPPLSVADPRSVIIAPQTQDYYPLLSPSSEDIPSLSPPVQSAQYFGPSHVPHIDTDRNEDQTTSCGGHNDLLYHTEFEVKSHNPEKLPPGDQAQEDHKKQNQIPHLSHSSGAADTVQGGANENKELASTAWVKVTRSGITGPFEGQKNSDEASADISAGSERNQDEIMGQEVRGKTWSDVVHNNVTEEPKNLVKDKDAMSVNSIDWPSLGNQAGPPRKILPPIRPVGHSKPSPIHAVRPATISKQCPRRIDDNDNDNDHNRKAIVPRPGRVVEYTTLYVPRLPEDFNDSKLRALCEQFGKVVYARAVIDRYTGKCREYGYVKFSTRAECLAAIEGLRPQGYFARFASPEKESMLKDAGDKNVYFANLPVTFRVDDFERMLDPYQVKSSRILYDISGKSRGVAFALMMTEEDAIAVINKFHGSVVPGSENALTVKLAEKPDLKPSNKDADGSDEYLCRPPQKQLGHFIKDRKNDYTGFDGWL